MAATKELPGILVPVIGIPTNMLAVEVIPVIDGEFCVSTPVPRLLMGESAAAALRISVLPATISMPPGALTELLQMTRFVVKVSVIRRTGGKVL